MGNLSQGEVHTVCTCMLHYDVQHVGSKHPRFELRGSVVHVVEAECFFGLSVAHCAAVWHFMGELRGTCIRQALFAPPHFQKLVYEHVKSMFDTAVLSQSCQPAKLTKPGQPGL